MTAKRNEHDQLIDLNKLTQRELLIRLYDKVQRIEETQEEMDERGQKMALKVNSLEVKSKVWGAIAGFLSAMGLLGIQLLIERFFNQ